MERISRVCQLMAIIIFIVHGIRCEPPNEKDLDSLIKEIFAIPNIDQTLPPTDAPHTSVVTPAPTPPPTPPPTQPPTPAPQTPTPQPQYPTHVTEHSSVHEPSSETEPNVSASITPKWRAIANFTFN